MTAGAPLVLVAASWAVVLLAENCRIPFDDPNTHLELTMIHEVMVLDHGGPAFGLVLYGASVKLFVLSALFLRVVFPFSATDPGLDWLAFVAGILLVAIVDRRRRVGHGAAAARPGAAAPRRRPASSRPSACPPRRGDAMTHPVDILLVLVILLNFLVLGTPALRVTIRGAAAPGGDPRGPPAPRPPRLRLARRGDRGRRRWRSRGS